ncbi:MAG: hypothetical protein V4608_17435 [Bacteroidota bacterium]
MQAYLSDDAFLAILGLKALFLMNNAQKRIKKRGFNPKSGFYGVLII